MKILMVLTSHDQLGDTGKKTGFWLEEFAAPYYVLKDAGAEIVLASPKGGQPPLDPKSDEPDAQTEATHRFRADEAAQKALASTVTLSSVKADDFDAVFYPGGHGPLWDLTEDKASIKLIEDFAKADKPVGKLLMRFHKRIVEGNGQRPRHRRIGEIDHRLGERQRLDVDTLAIHVGDAHVEIGEALLQRPRMQRTDIDDRAARIAPHTGTALAALGFERRDVAFRKIMRMDIDPARAVFARVCHMSPWCL